MIQASDFVSKVRYALDDNWGYVWGCYGQTWTAAKQAAATRPTTVQYGAQWIGHRVADCSGLGYWAFKELGMTIYHGSDTIWRQYVTDRCELVDGKRADGGTILPGDPVFLVEMKDGVKNRHHIGYYVGGYVIEAKGTKYGVVTSPLTHWHETAHWKNVDYEGVVFTAEPTLKKGASGEDVRELQLLLNNYGYGLGVDGKFGEKTRQAVMQFQASNGLKADGIVGDQTWAKLKNENPIINPDAETVRPDCVQIERRVLTDIRQKCYDVIEYINRALDEG